MGLFAKSFILFLVAMSVPLLYRQFADDTTIKFFSSYYSNYKNIDQFLRQSANHLDLAKQYVSDPDRLQGIVDKVQQQYKSIVSMAITQEKLNEKADNKKESKEAEVKFVSCHNEDLSGKKIRLWNKEELSKFDGSTVDSDIYLAFLGLVYNVTVNSQHYAQGAEYNAFAGRDATRAFITGNFTHDLHDDIVDIEEGLYSHVESWASFYTSHYPVLGRIEGNYYDLLGCETKELKRVYQIFQKLEQDKSKSQEQEKDFPECNSEWNSDTKKGKVWCSTKSGGIERDWVGVPRIYTNGESSRCACFNILGSDPEEFKEVLSVYPGCDQEASECILTQ